MKSRWLYKEYLVKFISRILQGHVFYSKIMSEIIENAPPYIPEENLIIGKMQHLISVYPCILEGGGGDGGGNGRDSVRHLARIDRDITKINRRVGIRREMLYVFIYSSGCI